MKYQLFSEKDHEKWNKELLEIHKRCCKAYLIQKDLKHTYIRKFFIIYDKYISERNILNFYFRPIKYFVQAIVLNQLNKISDYEYPVKPKRKRTRRSKR